MEQAHEILKSSTSESHRLIEQKMSDYFERPTLENYKEMILKYASLYQVVENQFQIFVDVMPGLELGKRLRKFELLQKDLADLQVTKEIPTGFQPMPVNSKAEFLGAMYVLEGSTLGGQVLLKRFKETLGISETQGGHFLSAYGSEVGLMWRRFLAEMNQTLQTQEEIQQAVQAAQKMFVLIGDWMQPTPHQAPKAEPSV